MEGIYAKKSELYAVIMRFFAWSRPVCYNLCDGRSGLTPMKQFSVEAVGHSYLSSITLLTPFETDLSAVGGGMALLF